MDGRLDADGADAANHAGGGAGGSILVEACELILVCFIGLDLVILWITIELIRCILYIYK